MRGAVFPPHMAVVRLVGAGDDVEHGGAPFGLIVLSAGTLRDQSSAIQPGGAPRFGTSYAIS